MKKSIKPGMTPQLIQELNDLLKGKIQISEEPSSDNRLADLFMNRDQSFFPEECEKYIRASYLGDLPEESPMILGHQYKWDIGGFYNSIIFEQGSPGYYYMSQSTGGPVYTSEYFATDNHIIVVNWHRGPTGTAIIKDRNTFQGLEKFEFDRNQRQEFLDLIY